MSTAEVEKVLFQLPGTVVDADGEGGLTVQTEHGIAPARRAVSCLVEPEPGDHVLLFGLDETRYWVLAILERTGDAPLRVLADRDLSIGVRAGRFRVAAAEGVDLVTPREMTLRATDFRLRAETGHVILDRLFHIGGEVLSRLRRMKLVGSVVDAVVERVSQRIQRSYRMVSEQDVVRAHELDYRAEENVNLRGRNTLIVSERISKVDGSQIQLG